MSGRFDSRALTIAEVVERGLVTAIFQPVVWLGTGKIFGYVGSICGPSGDLLCAPQRLKQAAWQEGLLLELENLALKTILKGFVDSQLQGVLFPQFDIDVFSVANRLKDIRLGKLAAQIGIEAARVVPFISGIFSEFEDGAGLLQKVLARYEEHGHALAIDDVAEAGNAHGAKKGRVPAYAMLERDLIEDIDKELAKLQLIKSQVESFSDNSSCQLIAMGITTRSEFLLLNEIGVQLGLGDFISKPSKVAAVTPSREVLNVISQKTNGGEERNRTASIIERVPAFSLESCNEDVFLLFEKNPQVTVVAVLNNGMPIGLINRGVFISRYARPYQRELYGKKSCTSFMDPEPLIVDKSISIPELSRLLAEDQRHISMGFIFTDNGLYLGVGTSQNLIHEITEMQVQSARYANPLTGLPGNAKIDEEVNARLQARETFCLAYFDLDNFKPFNDVYGFSVGDAVIQMTAKVIVECCDAERDFIGHIGGDDFIVLFSGKGWEQHCRHMLERFAVEVGSFFNAADLERGGYIAENRRGEKEFHSLVSLSIGAVIAEPGLFQSHHELAVVASESKKKAKKELGNSLYINQRDYH